MGAEMKWAENKIRWFLFYFIFGSLFYIVLFPASIIWKILSEYILPDIKFYYRFYLTSYFENIVEGKDGYDEIYQTREERLEMFNKIAAHEGHNWWIRQKLQRHLKLINKRFNYEPIRHQETPACP